MRATKITAACWLMVAAVAAAVGGAFLAQLGWPFEIASSLLPHIAAGALVIAVGVLLLRRPLAAGALVLLAALALFGARALFTPAAPALAHKDLRILWANVWGRTKAFDRTIALAQYENADVVLIAEAPLARVRQLGDLDVGPFVHHVGRLDIEGVNVVALSRQPIEGATAFGGTKRVTRRGLSFTVQTAAGPLLIEGLHPSVPALPPQQVERDTTIRAAFALGDAAPRVVVGDLNAVTWSPLMGEAARAGLVEAGLGPQATWSPGRLPLILGLPIDHAFAGGGAQAYARIGADVGSDHRPLVIDVALPATR
jgi:endonuclease/exonuclease/phosphatase (EEP) superfamily protein YafD